MKKDIEFPQVEGVSVVIAREKNELEQDEWKAYLVNDNEKELNTIFVTSQGYASSEAGVDFPEKTSILRHAIPKLGAKDYAMIEIVTEEVFRLNNEFWVSYYIDEKLYDKKFIFLPFTIQEKNLQKIPILDMEGILHK
ncbi:MAG: hypothetical protein EAZ85_11255 [Bacteroidetes bacterium]|nr:MAG: hypothetical protein EAZ85_11255 [Bacteroidota bacterium]TAG90492.1 MAG: hypothetical protein EAZ20_04250 [Bacteroidota bacterium]